MKPDEKISRRHFLTVVATGAAVGAVAAVGGYYYGVTRQPTAPGPTAPTKYGGTVRFALNWLPSSLDPSIVPDIPVHMVAMNIFNNLVKWSPEFNVVSDLALSYDLSPDSKSYTFHLREGVKFHDGSDFNAEAVKYSYERIIDPETGSRVRGYFEDVDNIEVVDTHTVKFTLKSPSSVFIEGHMLWGFGKGPGIQSKQAIEELGDEEFGRNPVGTGPFKFASWEADNVITLVKNENYFEEGLPYLDKIVYIPVPDPFVRTVNIRTGNVDIAPELDFASYSILTQDTNIKAFTGPTFSIDRIILNMDRPPLDDLRVRQAFSLGIDREGMNNVSLLGLGIAAYRRISPKSPVHTPEKLSNYAYDPEKARELLDATGKTPEELKFTIDVTKLGQSVEQATFIQSNLMDIGWEVEMNLREASAMFTDLFARNFDAMVVYNSVGADVGRYFESFPTGATLNFYGYSNPEFDSLWEQQKTEPDFKRRKQLFDEIEKIINDDMPAITLLWRPFLDAVLTKVKNYPATGWNTFYMEEVWIEE